MEVKQFWIEEDDYSKPHRFVFESDHLATVQALQARIVELEEALKKSVDDLTWMSGANDFSPEGKAVKGWRTVQMHIERFNELLGEPK